MKTSSQLMLVKDVNNQIERLYAKYSAVIDESMRSVSSDKNRFHSWNGLQSPNVRIHL